MNTPSGATILHRLDSASQSRQVNPAIAPDAKRAKVLVVDDNYLTRSLAAELLQVEGYDVLEAESGLAALERIAQDPPDLILLDVVMPQIDGYEVCHRLKQTQAGQSIPVVFMTVSDDRQSRLRGMQVGGDDFITKPLDRLELSARVKNWVRQKHLNDDLDRTERALFSIAKAIEGRYSPKSGSGERLASLAQSFGEYLQLSASEIQDLSNAAHLHDIGTVAIPDAVLLKQGELTPEERELINQHVLIGETLCQPLRNFQGVLPIIRHHHERWDGSGYPDGLSAQAIPRLAQIFQIVDIYNALTSPRPYKQPLEQQDALEIMAQEASKGWRNPELVAQFQLFIQKKGESLNIEH